MKTIVALLCLASPLIARAEEYKGNLAVRVIRLLPRHPSIGDVEDAMMAAQSGPHDSPAMVPKVFYALHDGSKINGNAAGPYGAYRKAIPEDPLPTGVRLYFECGFLEGQMILAARPSEIRTTRETQIDRSRSVREVVFSVYEADEARGPHGEEDLVLLQHTLGRATRSKRGGWPARWRYRSIRLSFSPHYGLLAEFPAAPSRSARKGLP